MPLAEKVAALLEAVTPADVQALPPTARRRFAAACRHAADMAEPRQPEPKSGVLLDLKRGVPRHE